MLRGQYIPSEVRWLDESGEVKTEKVVPETTRKTTRGKPVARDELPKLYLFGINRSRVEQAAKEMDLSLDMVDNLRNANLFVTSKSYYRRKLPKVRDAEDANLPIYVLRSNTPHQFRQMLNTIYHTESTNPFKLALGEAEEAVSQIRNGQEETVELGPQSAYIRRLQHLIAERNALASQSTGKDPNRRVRIYRG